MVQELSDADRFDRLSRVATEIVETGDRVFEFDAPATGEETEVTGEPTYRAEVDSLGYLSSVAFVAESDEASVSGAAEYGNFNGPQSITPPPAEEVVARHSPVHDEGELEGMLEANL